MGTAYPSERGRDALITRVERRDPPERSSIHSGDERGYLAGSFHGGGHTAGAGGKEARRRLGDSLLPSHMVGPIADSLVRVGANWESSKRTKDELYASSRSASFPVL